MIPEQRARLERMSHDLLSPANREAVAAALAHIDALEADVAQRDADMRLRENWFNEMTDKLEVERNKYRQKFFIADGRLGKAQNEIDALAAERDALVKRLAERDVEVANQRTAIHTLGQLVQQAEREREEARAARDHDVEQYGRALQAYEAQVVALETAKEQAERTAAALKTAIAAVLPELVVMAHEPHCEVLAPEIRDSFRRAVQAFTAALAPTKEEA